MSATPVPPNDRRRDARARRRRLARRLKRGALIAAAVAIAAAILVAWLPDPVAVDVAAVRRGALQVEIVEDGRTRVRERFVVVAPTAGRLQRVELDPGDAVAAGDEVARIEPAELDARARREARARRALAEARRRAADAAVARARATRDLAERDRERARVLVRHGAIAAAKGDEAELRAEVAGQDAAAAEHEQRGAAAEVAAVRAALDARDGGTARAAAVRAPATGRVLRVLRDGAGPIAAGTPLLELGDPRALEVVIDVLSRDAAQIAPGMPVWIERWGGPRALRAEVAVVEPSAFTRTSALGVEEQRVRVIARLPAPPPALGDAYRVTARVVTWRAGDVLIAPASAVFRAREGWAVYVVAGGRARIRPVEIGRRGRLDVQILRGLAEGEQVVAYPSDDVHDGARVAPR